MTQNNVLKNQKPTKMPANVTLLIPKQALKGGIHLHEEQSAVLD